MYDNMYTTKSKKNFEWTLRALEWGRIWINTWIMIQWPQVLGKQGLADRREKKKEKERKKLAVSHQNDFRLWQHAAITNFIVLCLFEGGRQAMVAEESVRERTLLGLSEIQSRECASQFSVWSYFLFAIMPHVDLLVGSAGVVVRSGLGRALQTEVALNKKRMAEWSETCSAIFLGVTLKSCRAW